MGEIHGCGRDADSQSMDDSISYGFLEVHFSEELGFAGGLLLVDQDARPLEFHCTTPVPVNRTEKILYGATYNELIKLAERIAPSILFVAEPGSSDTIHDVQYPEMLIDGVSVQVLTSDVEHFEFARAACERFTTSVSLDEPFERIRGAIREAQQSALKAA